MSGNNNKRGQKMPMKGAIGLWQAVGRSLDFTQLPSEEL